MTGVLPLPAPETPGTRWPLAGAAAAPEGGPWPKVSVITPSYNQGVFIEETIRSVLLQGYPNLEYIVMDGGSTDNSVEVIRKYEPWISHWVSEKDNGQSDAINRGWQRATGDIVAWLNADDLYCEGAILNAVRALQREPDAQMIYGSVDVIDEHGNHSGWLQIPERFDVLEMLRSFNNIVPSVTLFVRREALAAVGLLRTDLHYTMDFEFALRLGLRGKVTREPSVKSLVRVHNSAKSSVGGPAGVLEMYEAVRQVQLTTKRRDVARACGEGLALACTQLSLAYVQIGDLRRALEWRLRSLARALLRANRKSMLALLVPGRIFPFVRKYRAGYAGDSVKVIWSEAAPAHDNRSGNRKADH